MTAVSRVGDFELAFGESLRWDATRNRLYFVDCLQSRLHWLEGGEPPLQGMTLPGLPTGVVLTTGLQLVICLDDGLFVVDPDSERAELLSAYPAGLGGRANDANADPEGNLVTGTLNLEPGKGGFWRFSLLDGWTELDGSISNANGPTFTHIGGDLHLVFADTHARRVYAYPYHPTAGSVGTRITLADYAEVDGAPDGATTDATGAVWSCVLSAGKIARLTSEGVDTLIEAGVPNPTDVAFGGPGLDRLFFTSTPLGGPDPSPAGSRWLQVVDGLQVTGAADLRFNLPEDWQAIPSRRT
jgi:sugar lactone lactonase YvrE